LISFGDNRGGLKSTCQANAVKRPSKDTVVDDQ
jgi:hypothetical protein